MLRTATGLRGPAVRRAPDAGKGNLGGCNGGADTDDRRTDEAPRIGERPHHLGPLDWPQGTRGTGALGAGQRDGFADRDLRPRQRRSRSAEASSAPLRSLRAARRAHAGSGPAADIYTKDQRSIAAAARKARVVSAKLTQRAQ